MSGWWALAVVCYLLAGVLAFVVMTVLTMDAPSSAVAIGLRIVAFLLWPLCVLTVILVLLWVVVSG
jgi:hypothetical protein